MKKLFFVSVAFCIFSGTSYQAAAQKSLRFINHIELLGEKVLPASSTFTPETITLLTSDVNMSSTEMCKSLQFKYAQMTEQEVENLHNIRLYSVIEDWYNTRYRLGGNSRKGIDCSSFVAMLADATYNTCLSRTAREQYYQTIRINVEELKEGDLVFFNTRGGISHVGMYLANGYFVHSSSSNGVIISSMTESYYESRYAGAGRIACTTAALNCD